MDVGKRYDRMLDEMEFLYQQRRDARAYVGELIQHGDVDEGVLVDLLTLLADRVKEGAK